MRASLLLTGLLGIALSTQAIAQDATNTNTNNTAPATNAAAPASTAPVNAASNAAGTNAATPAATGDSQIESTVHQYLIKKPEVVVEALQAYQQKQMESMQQLFKDTQKIAPKYANDLFHQNTDPSGGNANGTITIVEFSDYQCSHCIQTSSVVDAIIKADPNLRVVVKEFPIRGPISEAAARAALAANKQGKYWVFRDALFKNGNALTQDKIMEVAKSIGLNMDQLKKDMDDAAIKKTVADNQKLAQNLKLIGTPAFFIARSDIKADAPANMINYIPGVITQVQLQAVINQINKTKT